MDPEELLAICKPTFETLAQKFGNVGISLGILKDENSNYLGIGGESDEHTVYLISSVTKPILAVAVGILVSSGKLRFDTLLKDIIPLHNSTSLTVADLLDHRSKLFRCDRLWEGHDGKIYINDKRTIVGLFNRLPPNKHYANESDFHYTRNYNNLGFALLGIVIEKLSGMSWAEFVHTRIFDPLGMTRSTADMQCRPPRPTANIADSLCSDINGDEQRDRLGDSGDSDTTHYRFLSNVTDNTISASHVRLSRCSDKLSKIGAAAGVRSTTSDLLKLFRVFTKSERLGGGLAEVEAGVDSILGHINSVPPDRKFAYAGGWNIVNLPWDRIQRAPGADGENYLRLQAVAKLGVAGIDDLWPFKQGGHHQTQRLALSHGGNMVGATSFAFAVPSMRLAVVGLCNARGFHFDIVNTMVLTLAECLYSMYGKADVETRLRNARLMGDHCAARYLFEAGEYEKGFENYEKEFASVSTYEDLIGKYHFTEDIFLEIVADETHEHLELRYGGDRHPLRVKRGHSFDTCKLTMSFASSITELHEVGLGGKHWLNHRSSEVTFLRDKGDSRFARIFWPFEDVDEDNAFIKELR
jgi:CubicO group peptidase (beta-lactamase class C family)